MTDYIDIAKPAEVDNEKYFSLFMTNMNKYCQEKNINVDNVFNPKSHHLCAEYRFKGNQTVLKIYEIEPNDKKILESVLNAVDETTPEPPIWILPEEPKDRLTRKDLWAIKDKALANDAIMNCFGYILQKKIEKSGKRMFIVNTLFFSYIYQTNKIYCHEKRARAYMKSFDINDYDTIFVPHFIGQPGVIGHWALITICLKEKVIYNIDSLNMDGKERMKSILYWLFDVNLANHHEFLSVDEWYLKNNAIETQQTNSVDCGYYVLNYMKYIIEGRELNGLSDLHMAGFRDFVGLSLARKCQEYQKIPIDVDKKAEDEIDDEGFVLVK
jgi:hypothetical protein